MEENEISDPFCTMHFYKMLSKQPRKNDTNAKRTAQEWFAKFENDIRNLGESQNIFEASSE